jgi:Uma2 family endonuclease
MIEALGPNLRRRDIRCAILVALSRFLAETTLGEALFGIDIQVDSNTVYHPDVVYWDAQRLATIDQDSVPVQTIPQLVVEVLSSSISYGNLLRKVAAYQRAGVHTLWIVNDDPLEISVFDPSGRRIVTGDGFLRLPELLPGFSLGVAQLLPSE